MGGRHHKATAGRSVAAANTLLPDAAQTNCTANPAAPAANTPAHMLICLRLCCCNCLPACHTHLCDQLRSNNVKLLGKCWVVRLHVDHCCHRHQRCKRLLQLHLKRHGSVVGKACACRQTQYTHRYGRCQTKHNIA